MHRYFNTRSQQVHDICYTTVTFCDTSSLRLWSNGNFFCKANEDLWVEQIRHQRMLHYGCRGNNSVLQQYARNYLCFQKLSKDRFPFQSTLGDLQPRTGNGKAIGLVVY